MPKNNSLIDNDFIEEGDEDQFDPFKDDHEEDRAPFNDKELFVEDKKAAKEKDGFEVEIVDDTPEEDKNKWVADDERDGEPDIPDEDEVKEYSKNVQDRISKLTARMHAERRAREERERQFNEAIDFGKRILDENNRLKELVEGGEKVLLDEHKGRLEGQLSAAKARYREATEAGDTDGIIAAQEEISRAVAQMERLTGHQPQTLPRSDPEYFNRYAPQQEQKDQQNQRVGPSEQALEWRKRNPWFDNDVTMQAFALGVHRQLVDNGVEVDTPDYYKAIDKEVRSRFPERFKREASRRQDTVVAPANRSSQRTPGRKVRLTESQVRIAKRLGLTPQQYAEQLILEQTNGNRSEFTHSS